MLDYPAAKGIPIDHINNVYIHQEHTMGMIICAQSERWDVGIHIRDNCGDFDTAQKKALSTVFSTNGESHAAHIDMADHLKLAAITTLDYLTAKGIPIEPPKTPSHIRCVAYHREVET